MTGSFLAHWIVSAALLLLVAQIVPRMKVTGAVSAMLAAGVLGLANALVRPIAVILTLPLTLLTFGLFLLVVNAAMLKLTALVVPGFRVRGWLPAMAASLLLTILNVLIETWIGPAW